MLKYVVIAIGRLTSYIWWPFAVKAHLCHRACHWKRFI